MVGLREGRKERAEVGSSKMQVSGENMGKLHNKAQYLAIEKGLKRRKSRQGAGAGNVR